VKFSRRKRRLPQVIIVSLIDIFAILLIFVIVTTTFKKPEPNVQINLPESKSAVVAEKSDEPVVLTIKDDQTIYYEKQVFKMEGLEAALATILNGPKKPPVTLKADKNVSFQFVLDVLGELKKAGVEGKVSFLTEPKS
jgi:biopolymer transport protein ExbD